MNLIGSVTTEGALTIRSELDEISHKTGRKGMSNQMHALSIGRTDSTGSGTTRSLHDIKRMICLVQCPKLDWKQDDACRLRGVH